MAKEKKERKKKVETERKVSVKMFGYFLWLKNILCKSFFSGSTFICVVLKARAWALAGGGGGKEGSFLIPGFANLIS